LRRDNSVQDFIAQEGAASLQALFGRLLGRFSAGGRLGSQRIAACQSGGGKAGREDCADHDEYPGQANRTCPADMFRSVGGMTGFFMASLRSQQLSRRSKPIRSAGYLATMNCVSDGGCDAM
jgi:hypothetical protein